MSLSLLGRLVARLRVVNLAGRIPMSTTSTKSPTSTEEAVCSLLNTDKLNWDGSLSFECMKRAVSSLELHEKTSMAQALDKIHEGVNIVVTKEMEMDASVIRGLPNSVRLICEAGTGFNNIDCDAAKTRGITVCNVPEYSTEAVATMVMTFVLSFSSSLMQQQQKLWGATADKKAWATLEGLSHFELSGKTIGLIGGRGLIGSKVSEMARIFGMKVSRFAMKLLFERLTLVCLIRASIFLRFWCQVRAASHVRALQSLAWRNCCVSLTL